METLRQKRAHVLVLAGSIRQDSIHRKLAEAAVSELNRAGVDAVFADFRDYSMPMYDGDLEAAHGLPGKAKAFKELVRAADAILIASPEYNGSFPALLKNAIDWASRPEGGERPAAVFRGKIAALMAGSPGQGGGVRGLRHLRELLEMIGVTVIAEQVVVPGAHQAFGPEGEMLRATDGAQLRRLVSSLARAIAPQTEAAA